MFDLLLQQEDFVLHDVPDDLHVDAEVLVDEDVPETAIFFHSTSGCRRRTSWGNLLTASPAPEHG